MIINSSTKWIKSNQEYLAQSVEQIRVLLENYKPQEQVRSSTRSSRSSRSKTSSHEKNLPEWKDQDQPALEILCRAFGLSSFERSILLLCAGVELYGDFARLCAEAQANSNAAYPTFGLALAAFPNPYWSAVTPASALRRFGIIELPSPSLMPLISAPLRIDERVLHYLTGVSYLEPRLAGMIRPIEDDMPLSTSHRAIVAQIVDSCRKSGETSRIPVIQLQGMDLSSKHAIAKEVCKELGLNLWHLSSEIIQANVNGEVQAVIKYWPREAVLLNSGLHISAEEDEPNVQRNIARLIANIPGPIFLGTRERWDISLLSHISFDVRKPTKIEQFDLWKSLLGNTYSDIEYNAQRLTNQFDLEESKILAICQEAQLLSANTATSLSEALWNASLEITRPKMAGLAERVVSSATMRDLVLPEKEKELLQEIVIHVPNRNKVYEEWGFGSLTSRGLGVTALFSGLSGTGKTMAAEVLANELGLDLYKIDLSTVVSKYIGETEKNIRRVFDAAEDGGTILFFDEADALFGKRTEVHQSLDRHANIEISYLLMKMESYRGLAILATNMKNALDTAFLRRIRFVVNFPFPDYNSRKEIWKSAFPPATPLGEIDYESLAQLNISGGNIRNIAYRTE
jgi:hypothetical protein